MHIKTKVGCADLGPRTVSGRPAGPAVWQGLAALGRGAEDFFRPEIFEEDPRLTWAFWRHFCAACREAEPHGGHDLVRSWADRAALGGFVATSSVDGLWLASGWPEARVLEVDIT